MGMNICEKNCKINTINFLNYGVILGPGVFVQFVTTCLKECTSSNSKLIMTFYYN